MSAYFEFLQTNKFWCRAVDLLNDHESYVRAKSVTLIGSLLSVRPLWDIFSKEQNMTVVSIVKCFL